MLEIKLSALRIKLTCKYLYAGLVGVNRLLMKLKLLMAACHGT